MKDYSYFSIDNLEYLDRMFAQYQESPETLSNDWKHFFDGYEFFKKYSKGTSDFDKELKALKLIEAYRSFGHLKANLDPLGVQKRRSEWLEPSRYGITDKELNETFQAGKLVLGKEARLSEIIAHMEKVYCGTFTVQYEDVPPEIREWVLTEVEKGKRPEYSKTEKKMFFDELLKTEAIEKFLHTRYVGVKRFSGEGIDSVLPVFNTILNKGAEIGITDIVVGMAHRGRLALLVNFFNRSFKELATLFDAKDAEGQSWFTADVKYHLGYSADRKSVAGKDVHVSLAFNPSHLEAVNPVVEGMVWAKQRMKGAAGKLNVLPLVVHGDAAFIGQGVVSETLQMSQLEGYSTGGTIHVVLDNQVGFTVDPVNSRSSVYTTDIMKPLQVPTFHANGDDVEACVYAAELAVKFRQKFKKDVAIRILGYRRHGHNEGDEPVFTQPLLYERIKNQPTPREVYQARLEKEGVFAAGEGNSLFDAEISRLQKLLDETRANYPKINYGRGQGLWKKIREVNLEEIREAAKTGVDEATLVKLAEQVLGAPAQIEILPKLKNVVDKRIATLREKKTVDWGGAELLSYASLLNEGYGIRLAGQDSQRGTFSHRHSVYHDFKTNKTVNILNGVNPEKAPFHVCDSLLSEYAALGFEYGVSTVDPNFLNIWEAQFGDFANGAQIAIDQFISSGEQKWQQMSGVVMLLPHGFEGQGPEHSSARLERFLQLSAEGNWYVCVPTTPANLFHMLRRQIKTDYRKPLVVMSPKSLLRHPKVVSSISELATGKFREAIGDDTIKDVRKVKRAIICSGKVYYDLLDKREEYKVGDEVALLRAEQVYPFPHRDLLEDLSRYLNLKEIIWCQEEPENMGALQFARPKLNRLKSDLGKKELGLGYIARPERSSPATGSAYRHKAEQEELIKKALILNS